MPVKKTVAKKVAPKTSAKKVAPKPVVKKDPNAANKKKLVTHLLTITNSNLSKIYGTPVKGKSKKALELEVAIASFGGYAPHVAKVMSILTGEKIEASANSGLASEMKPGVMFVPLTNPNDHNYPMGKASMATNHNQSHCLRPDGRHGNNMDTDISSLRPATEAEIREFVEKQYDNIIAELGIVFV